MDISINNKKNYVGPNVEFVSILSENILVGSNEAFYGEEDPLELGI